MHVVSPQPGQLETEEYPETLGVPEEWPVFQEPLAIVREADILVQCEVPFGNEAALLLHHAEEENVDRIVLGGLGSNDGCWGWCPSCADCLWAQVIVPCP